MEREWKYGFLNPRGEFFERHSNHEQWAGNYVTEHGLWQEYSKWDSFAKGCAEFLVMVKKWVLLHSPSGGEPIISCCGRRITKRQTDFLYEYFGHGGWIEMLY